MNTNTTNSVINLDSESFSEKLRSDPNACFVGC